MALLDPDRADDDYGLLDEISASFLRTIKQFYTRDTAMEVMEALTPVLGKDWKGRLIFGVVANKFTRVTSIRITRDVNQPMQKINAIKAYRALTGKGLTESKSEIEDSELRTVDAQVRKPEELGYTGSQEGEKMILGYIEELRRAGYKVLIL